MIKGIGVDIVKIERVLDKHSKLATKVLTTKEYEIYKKLDEKRQAEYFADRFAGKEAYYKALGSRSIGYQDFEILNANDGTPYSNVPGVLISLSHDGDYAIAFVVIEN